MDWFKASSHLILPLLNEKRKAWDDLASNTGTREKYVKAAKAVRAATRKAKTDYVLSLTNEMEGTNPDIQGARFFFLAKKIQRNLSADTKVRVSKKSTIPVNKWLQHFTEVFAERPYNADAFSAIPHKPVMSELDDPPTLEEVHQAIYRTKNGTAPGFDYLGIELFKWGGERLEDILLNLFTKMWQVPSRIPPEWANSVMITLFKGKGSRDDCNNYRGISLLDVAGKILAGVVNQRIQRLVEHVMPDYQMGFRSDRSTQRAIFALRQLAEKCRIAERPLFAVYVDLVKAFDSVPRPLLWDALTRRGCPPKLLTVIRKFHDGGKAFLRESDQLHGPISVLSGVRQGCRMAPGLFNIFFDCVIEISKLKPLDVGSLVREYGFLKKPPTVLETPITNHLAFADDLVLLDLSALSLQGECNKLSHSLALAGVQESLTKTEVQTLSDGGLDEPLIIKMRDTPLRVTSAFTYLGSPMSSDGKAADWVMHRLKRARTVSSAMSLVWSQKSILSRKIKVRLFKTIVLPSLLYSCETLQFTKREEERCNAFIRTRLRCILGINDRKHMSSAEIHLATKVHSFAALVAKRRITWLRTLFLKKEYLSTLAYLFLSMGKCRNGGRCAQLWVKHLKLSCDLINLPIDGLLTHVALDRLEVLEPKRRPIANVPEDQHSQPEGHGESNIITADRGNVCLPRAKSFDCPYCSFAHSERKGLNRHINSFHPTAPEADPMKKARVPVGPLKCPVEGCVAGYKTKGKLDAHIYSCHPERSVVLSSHNGDNNVVLHQESIIGHSCPVLNCDKVINSMKGLENHCYRIHKFSLRKLASTDGSIVLMKDGVVGPPPRNSQ